MRAAEIWEKQIIVIVLIQVYNRENRHLSTVCCCGLADILYFCTS